MSELLVFAIIGLGLYGMYRLQSAAQEKDELRLRRKQGMKHWYQDQHGQPIPVTVTERRRYKG